MLPALYLLPVTLGDTPVETVLPSYNKEVILGIRYFIVEDVRSARRFLKKVDREIDIDSLTFYTLNKHTSPEDISGYLMPLEDGNSMGVISEAGCPAVADPGADVVAIAQRKNLRVIPLVGPDKYSIELCDYYNSIDKNHCRMIIYNGQPHVFTGKYKVIAAKDIYEFINS